MSASTVYPVPYHNQFRQDDARTYSAPSKLVQMQAVFRRKLQEEKERKLQEIQYGHTEKDIEFTKENRQNSLVRDFFLERRILHQSHEHLPEINQHYRQKRQEYERQQGKDHLPVLKKYKTTADTSVAKGGYTAENVKNEKHIPEKPLMAKPSHANTRRFINLQQKQSNIAVLQHPAKTYDQEDSRIPKMNKGSTNKQIATKEEYMNTKNVTGKTFENQTGENDVFENVNEMTPIEVAKLHQLRRRKLSQKTNIVEQNNDQNDTDNFTNMNNLPVNKNEKKDNRNAENLEFQSLLVQRGKIQSAGKVSSFQKWQQEQEARKKLQTQNNYVTDDLDDQNISRNNITIFDENKIGQNGSRKPEKIKLYHAGVEDNKVAKNSGINNRENIQVKATEASTFKARHDSAVARENSIKERKHAILKQQNLKMRERFHESPSQFQNEQQENNFVQEERHNDLKILKQNGQLKQSKPVKSDNTQRDKTQFPGPTENYPEKFEINKAVNEVNVRTDYEHSNQRNSRAPPRKASAHRIHSGKINKLQSDDRYKESVELYVKVAEMEQQKAGDANVSLTECYNCGRKFATDRLQTHIKACTKSTAKKRRVFDPVQMRTKGTEQEKFLNTDRSDNQENKKPSQWRKKHEDFINTLRYAKQATAAKAKGIDIGPPPVSQNDDYVPCPHCQRKFNSTAAERHIPKCKDIKSRPPAPTKYRK